MSETEFDTMVSEAMAVIKESWGQWRRGAHKEIVAQEAAIKRASKAHKFPIPAHYTAQVAQYHYWRERLR